MRTLTYKQRQFVANYLGKSNGNATDAARLAGYSTPQQAGSYILTRPAVQAAIAAKLEEAAMPADEVLARLSDMASADIDEFLDEYDHQNGVDEEGNPTYERRLKFNYRKAKSRGKSHLVKKIKVLPDGSIEFELHDSANALDKLAKYHGLLKDRVDVNVSLEDTEEERRRFTAVFAGFAQLTEHSGSGGDGEGGSQSLPGALCGSGVEGILDTSATLMLPEPSVAEGGDGGESEDPHLHATETWEE